MTNSAILGFHTSEKKFFETVSVFQKRFGCLWAFSTRVQDLGLNPVMVTKIEPTFLDDLTLCQRYYKEQQLPYSLVVPSYLHSDALELQLVDRGYALFETGVAMSLSLANFASPRSQSTIVLKEMHDNLPVWGTPLLYGFQSTPEELGVYLNVHEQASKKDPTFTYFSAFVDDIIVSSLTFSLSQSGARLDDIATMPVFQKKGYATALIYAALEYAKTKQVQTCFLEASSAGLNIYKKIGFRELFSNYYYHELGEKE